MKTFCFRPWLWVRLFLNSVIPGLAALSLAWHACGGMATENHFLSSYCYPDNDLGATWQPSRTCLKLWAPTALAVSVKWFSDPVTSRFSLLPMTSQSNGIWFLNIEGNQAGSYYLYQITLPGSISGSVRITEVNDPYAKGSSANSGRTLVFNPADTDPPGWVEDHFVGLRRNTDAILYEAHVRDFTINPQSGVNPEWRGRFLGFAQSGTVNSAGLATGLDHLVELGITHVHLLPVFDYAGGDERQGPGSYTWYDWGYDPVLYDNLEGSYSTQPNGTSRQAEFKKLIMALHRRGIGVVLDVVFNHTDAVGDAPFSIFDKIYPGYFYRTDAAGHPANASGCGNEFASERPMARKFILDSIQYWMREYHVDGFRFDLMGLLDKTTMKAVYQAAKAINPSAIIYGEGWSMEQVLPPDQMMTQSAVQGTGVAAFNDGIRDNIKGDAGNAPARGFIQGLAPPYGGMGMFYLNLKGQGTGRGPGAIPVFSPNETINYDSVHDDLCLWDKIAASAADQPESIREQMDKLAAGIILTAQGVPFLHAGDEFLRSKQGVANSYNNNDPDVNPIHWDLKTAHAGVFRFYRGLVAMRKAHPAFRMDQAAQVNACMEFVPGLGDHLVAYVLKDHANGDTWRNILVVYNGSGVKRQVAISGTWKVVADARDAGVDDLRTVFGPVSVEPFSLLVAHSADSISFLKQPPLTN